MKLNSAFLLTVLALLTHTSGGADLGTAFTYQGSLTDGNKPATGSYDFRFSIFDAPTGSDSVAAPVTVGAVSAKNGLFMTTIDFGVGVFAGAPRWLEIAVRTNGIGSFTTLATRQPLTPAPYSIFAGTASIVASGGAVRSINSLRDDVTFLAGPNVSITPSGNTLTIASLGSGGSGLWSLNGTSAYYNGGNVGIGTTAPNSKLTVRTTSLSPYGIEHSSGDVRMGTYISGPSAWFGTITDHPLNFFVNNGPPSMTLTTDGKVGIGATPPEQRLHVSGAQTGLELESTGVGDSSVIQYKIIGQSWYTGIGGARAGTLENKYYIYDDALRETRLVIDKSGNVGIGTTTPASGKLQVDGGAGTAVYAKSTTGAAIAADGNAIQNRDKGGFVKAMVYVQRNAATPTILRCYNGITGSSTEGCGFTLTKPLEGVFRIDFGFPVTDRFVSVTAEYDSQGTFAPRTLNAGANFRFFGSTAVEVFTFKANDAEDTLDANFMLILY